MSIFPTSTVKDLRERAINILKQYYKEDESELAIKNEQKMKFGLNIKFEYQDCCPVCIVEDKLMRIGKLAYSIRYNGKYYKFVTAGDFSFAIIDSVSNEGPAKQLITKEGSFQISELNSVIIESDKITFNIDRDDLKMTGKIIMSDFHPLKKKAMGPFSVFRMECSHEIDSMYHKLGGEIQYNGKYYSFKNGYGYIEGDSGVNFPKNYIWYNSVGENYGVTIAVATIPFGLIKFTGILGFVSFNNKEYYLSTYNLAKIIKKNDPTIVNLERELLIYFEVSSFGNSLEIGNESLMSFMLVGMLSFSIYFYVKECIKKLGQNKKQQYNT